MRWGGVGAGGGWRVAGEVWWWVMVRVVMVVVGREGVGRKG